MSRKFTLSGLVLAAAIAVLAGCGGGGAAPSGSKETSHLRVLTALYFQATSALGKRPESEQQFKEYLAGANLDLSVAGVGSVDELFVSDRDGEPVVVLYGAGVKGVDPSVVAYEKVGKDGVRLVGFISGQITEADEARFKKLVPAPAG